MTLKHPTEPPATGHRLIDAYLLDLDQVLSGLDEVERIDVVASVREHITAALSERSEPIGAADVEAILSQLGPVERIASAANFATPVYDLAGTDRVRGWSNRTAVLLIALSLLSLAILIPMPFVALPLGLGVAICAAFGTHAHKGSAASVPYWIATALGSLTLLLGLIGALTLIPSPY